jgi:hypothetical protein
MTRAHARGLALAALLLPLGLAACKRQHFPVGPVEELGYPSCPAGSGSGAPAAAASASPLEKTTTLVDRKLRSGEGDPRQTIVERFRVEKRGCLYALTTRQEWAMQIADVEVLYDEGLRPLRIWRRLTSPSSSRPDGSADIKRFDLRTPQITTKQRELTGRVSYEELRAPQKPTALIGPGRGIISMWLRRAKLQPGQKVREPALDFRGVEKVADTTLMRLPDQRVEGLGRVARVYTFLGRETVFADDDDMVLGDLAGLVPDERAPQPAPPAMPTFQPLDPVNTP